MRPWLRPTLATLVVLALCVWLFYPGPPGPFDSSPQVAGGPELRFVPPRLRIPSASCFDDEKRRVLFNIRGRSGDLRFSFDPDEKGSRIRPFGSFPERRKPRFMRETRLKRISKFFGLGSNRRANSAVVFCAEPDELWNAGVARVFWSTAEDYSPRFYLAGLLPNGKLGALPLTVNREFEHFAAVGKFIAWSEFTIARKKGARGDSTIQVIRRGDEVRIRWGKFPWEDVAGWMSGEATLRDTVLPGEAEGPALPALARYLSNNRYTSDGRRYATVLLLAGEQTLYRDILRVVECADGDPKVVFRVKSLNGDGSARSSA